MSTFLMPLETQTPAGGRGFDGARVVGAETHTDRISPDCDAAESFLKMLDEAGETFCFRTFSDDKSAPGTKGGRTYTASIAKAFDRLEKDNANGRGVFVVVNEGGQKADEITRIRAVFADTDGAPLAPIISCGLEPHGVVQTSPGKWHVYWLVDGLDLAQFKGTQRSIAQRFGTDASVCDLPRVMRLPGFDHCKSGRNRVTLQMMSNALPYPATEVLAHFPSEEADLGLASAMSPAMLRHHELGHADPKIIRDLSSALSAIPADDRALWIRMGAALHDAALYKEGRSLWLDWSATSSKHDPERDISVWDTIRGESTGYPSVFAEAARRGWVNPSSRAEMAKNGVTGVIGVTTSVSATMPVTRNKAEGVTGVAESGDISIPAEARPCWRVFECWTRVAEAGRMLQPGVWQFDMKPGKGDNPPTPSQTWVCSPLHVDAVTHDPQGNNYGRLLRFVTSRGKSRNWAMPMELLRGSGEEMRGELLSMGLEIGPSSHRLLAQYVQTQRPKATARCALQTGWCGETFILPDAIFGPDAMKDGEDAPGVIFQSGERARDEFSVSGTLEGWQAEIAALAVGNPLLALALSCAFAGPILAKCNGESGGVHFVGDSSTGKTTAIEAACSVWGGASYKRSWRATANGMEGAAILFNDGLLALDEISECDPREVGNIVYSLGNGRGKQRAGRTGNAREVGRWRCVVLSSGERTISTTMEDGGHKAKAGQGVRLLDVPASRRYGAWDELHGMASGTAFSDAVKRSSAKHYGHAARAFLTSLTADQADIGERLETMRARPEFAPIPNEGQDARVAGRFALFALAGELATEYGITGWSVGEAMNAASACLSAWRTMRGRGSDERRTILAQVSDFIDRHGDGRFSCVGAVSEMPIRDRAGWWRSGGADSRIYLFTSDGMREALRGFDFRRALAVLLEEQVIPQPSVDGKLSRSERIGSQTKRVYAVNCEMLTRAVDK